jgi:hypothetical protein
MNKKPKLTQEQKYLFHYYQTTIKNKGRLAVILSNIRTGKITIDKLSPFEKRYFEIFTIDNAREFVITCEEEKEKLKQELNEI